jgi:hypothetical protein
VRVTAEVTMQPVCSGSLHGAGQHSIGSLGGLPPGAGMQPLHHAPLQHDGMANMQTSAHAQLHQAASSLLHAPLQHDGMANMQPSAHVQLHSSLLHAPLQHDGMANMQSSAHALLNAASSSPSYPLYPPGMSQMAVGQQAARMQAAAGMQAAGMRSPAMLGAIDTKVANLTAPGLRITDERADLKRLRAIEKRSKAAERQRICRARKAAVQANSQAQGGQPLALQQEEDMDPVETYPAEPELPLTDEQLVYRAFHLPGASQEATAYQCDRLLDECDKGVYDVGSVADDEQRRAVALAILSRPRLAAVLEAAGISVPESAVEQLARLSPASTAGAPNIIITIY